MACGYDVPFLEEVEQRFQCPICLLVLKSPLQTACGHRFCEACIKQIIPFKNSVLTCPVDKTYTKVNQMFPDLATEREILSLQIQCPNVLDNCTWQAELRDMEKHLKVCDMEQVQCVNDCKLMFKRLEVNNHNTSCTHRRIPCPHCKEELLQHRLEGHKETCPKLPVTCSLCRETVPHRDELARHQDPEDGKCPKAVIKCPYNYVGCEFQTERQLITEHTQRPEALEEHMKLVLKLLMQQGAYVREITQDLNEVLENNRSVIPLLIQNDKKRRLEASELRERNVTGKLHWKVKFADPRQRAVSYSSPVFYTGCPGYKVQIILDMEGTREGSVRYTSLSLVLLSGENDNQVIFPFNATCIVTLYDQVKCPPQQKEHAVSHFIVREVPRNFSSTTTNVDRLHKRVSKYLKRPDLVGPTSRYLRNGCLHFDVTVIHSYPPLEGVCHNQGCCCPALMFHGLQMAINPQLQIAVNPQLQMAVNPQLQMANPLQMAVNPPIQMAVSPQPSVTSQTEASTQSTQITQDVASTPGN